MNTLPVSVIIVAKNAERTIGDCLKSIKSNNPAEIIIVDGNSTDETLKIARENTNRIYSDDGKGISLARQLGAEQASQEYIAYIDSDIIIPPGALAIMLKDLETSGADNIQATIRGLKSRTYWERAEDQHLQIRQKRNVGGFSCGITRRSVVLEIGFRSAIEAEDFDFLFRMKEAGYKSGNSSAVVYHVHRPTFKALVKQRLWYGRGKTQLIFKLGPNTPELWAPLVTCYWLSFCIVKGKLILIPYFIVIGIAETSGMVQGLFGSITNRSKKNVK